MFKRFRKNEDGILVVDFVVALPIMLTWLFASITIFDGFVKYNKVVKATATVANLISRMETTSNAELDNVFNLFKALANTTSQNSSMRITAIKQDPNDGPVVYWPYSSGTATDMTNDSTALDDLPPLVDGDYIMLIETTLDYEPMVNWDIFPSMTFQFAQPFVLRFTGKLENVDVDTNLTDDNSDGSDESQTNPPGA